MRMGDATATTTTVATGVAVPVDPRTLTQGLTTWQSPTAAFTDIQGIVTDPSTAFNSTNMMFTIGLLAVPLVLFMLLGGKR